MIPVWAFVVVVGLALVAQCVLVVAFLHELRPLVRAVVAKHSGELALSDSVAEPHHVPKQGSVEFEPRARVMGLGG